LSQQTKAFVAFSSQDDDDHFASETIYLKHPDNLKENRSKLHNKEA
jgi:hypothetical protein